MSKDCKDCNAKLSPDAKCCNSCGQRAQAAGVQAQIPANTAFAAAAAGEVGFPHALPAAGDLPAAVGPLKCLFQGLMGLLRDFRAASKDKKRWVPALFLTVLWFVLTLFPLLGVNPVPVRWLSFLTFAQGGTSGGVTGLIGGVVGKGVFAYFLMSLAMPLTRGQKPFAGLGGGLKRFFQTLGDKSPTQLAPLLTGAGAALIGYNFMTGTASLQNSMIGIAALLLSLRTLSGKAGFLRRFLSSLTVKKTATGSLSNAVVNRIIAGMAAGFALGVPLSALNIEQLQLPYTLGVLLLIAGLILSFTHKPNKEVSA